MPPDAPDARAAPPWARVSRVFDEVAELPGDARADALDRLCRGADGHPDAALRAEVEGLLAADAEATTLGAPFLSDAASAAALLDDGPREGERVGPWRVLREIGRGGMGRVDLVERADGAYEQRAALKRLGLVAPGRVRRFLRERQILATLDHPGIARLLDGGVADDGAPYLVMEYAEGEPITAYADGHGLGLRARLRLFLQVCDAVAFAHRHLVVHRDLKPSNVLVGGREGTTAGADDTGTGAADGVPAGAHVTLLDFGIARLLDADADDPITAEGPGAPLTPGYAAPEQVAGEPVTTATDVWALGVLLYELLVGRRPFETASREAWAEAVLHGAPPAPSQAVREASTDARRLRGDLDAIALTALRREPEARYGSAHDLAADLRRYLAGEPVEARAPSALYRARRFVGRHRTAVAAAALVALAVVAGGAATAWQAREARAAAAESEATADFLVGLLGAADPFAVERRDTLRVGALLDEGVGRVRAELGDQPRVQARLLHVLGRTYRGVERWDESEPLLRDALALHRRLGAPAGTLADVLADLALTQSARAAHDEAIALGGEALRLAHAAGDAEGLLRAEHALGLARLRASAPGADSLLLAARAHASALYGDGGPVVATLDRFLGEMYLDSGQFGDARRHLARAIEVTTRAVGADHPALSGHYQTLALAGLMDGQAEAAAAAAARAMAIERATESGGTNGLANALTLHAQALRQLGRLDEAEAGLREAVPLFTRRASDRALPLGTLATVLREQGRLGEAIEAQAASYAALQSGPARRRPAVVSSGVKLAGMLQDAGRYAEAEAVLEEATSLRGDLDEAAERVLPMLDGQLAAARVALYEAWGRPEAAASWRALLPEDGAAGRHGVGAH